MAGDEPATFILGTGVGAHTEDRVPMVIARSTGQASGRAWSVAIGQPAKRVSLQHEPLQHADGSPKGPGQAALRVKTDSSSPILVVNPENRKLIVAEQPVSVRLAHLMGVAGDKFAIEHVAQ